MCVYSPKKKITIPKIFRGLVLKLKLQVGGGSILFPPFPQVPLDASMGVTTNVLKLFLFWGRKLYLTQINNNSNGLKFKDLLPLDLNDQKAAFNRLCLKPCKI